eukprot:840506-Alexandrium_andersonii.AAC.1
MSASLVGSEMCIRDSLGTATQGPATPPDEAVQVLLLLRVRGPLQLLLVVLKGNIPGDGAGLGVH